VAEIVRQPVDAIFLSGLATSPFKKNPAGKRMSKVVEARALAVSDPTKP